MLQKFQQKLRSMVRVTRKGDPHWIPTGAEIVRVPVIGEVVTFRRAVYAAFVGKIDGGEDVRATCEVSQCVRPEHTAVGPCRGRMSRPLDLAPLQSLIKEAPPSNLRAMVAGASAVAAQDDAVKLRVMAAVDSGMTLSQTSSVLGIPLGVVVALRNGASAEDLLRSA